MKHRHMARSRRSQRGVALVAVLCLVVTAGLLVSALITVTRISAQNTSSFVDHMRSGYVAEGAANRIRFLIEADRSVYGTADARDLDYEQEEYEHFLADGTEHTIDYYGTPVKFSISNGISGHVITNASGLSVLSTNRSEENLVTDAIDLFKAKLNDYIDADDTVSEDGMEVEDYKELDLDPLPRNAALEYREELLWIPGAAELLPTDADGRLSLIRNYRIDSTAAPSIYTATYAQLRTLGTLTAEQAVQVLDALKEWRLNKTPLEDQLDEELYALIQQKFSWKESNYYTVRISQTNDEMRPGARLIFTFQADGIGGPSSGVATYLEYFRF